MWYLNLPFPIEIDRSCFCVYKFSLIWNVTCSRKKITTDLQNRRIFHVIKLLLERFHQIWHIRDVTNHDESFAGFKLMDFDSKARGKFTLSYRNWSKLLTLWKIRSNGGFFLPMLLNDSPLNHSTTPNSLHSPLDHSTLPWITPHRKWKFQNKVPFSTARSPIMFWKYIDSDAKVR